MTEIFEKQPKITFRGYLIFCNLAVLEFPFWRLQDSLNSTNTVPCVYWFLLWVSQK